MQIKVHGEMTLAEIRQALFEKLNQIEDDHAVRYSRGATLFIHPTNGFGDRVTPRYENGEEVKKINTRGPYRSAADQFMP